MTGPLIDQALQLLHAGAAEYLSPETTHERREAIFKGWRDEIVTRTGADPCAARVALVQVMRAYNRALVTNRRAKQDPRLS